MQDKLITKSSIKIAVITAIAMAILFGAGTKVWRHFSRQNPPELPYSEADVTPIPPAQRAAARAWFEKNKVDIATLLREPRLARAKRLTFLTYRFCHPGAASVPDINELYSRCVAACGGIAYVYRGLADVVGLKTRYARIYNIPNQGNHVAVEVKLSDHEWGFFDPTFGLFFSDNGLIAGKALSLSQIALRLKIPELDHYVVQASRNEKLSFNAPLASMFDARYHHPLMPIANYYNYEARSHDDPNELVVLSVPIVAKTLPVKMGAFNSDNYGELAAGWLNYTNGTLNDSNPANDTSYNVSYVSNIRENFVIVYAISELVPGNYYVLSLRTMNSLDEPQRLQIASIGRGSRLLTNGVFRLRKGVATVSIPFRAESSAAEIYVHNVEPDGTIEIFAVKLASEEVADKQ